MAHMSMITFLKYKTLTNFFCFVNLTFIYQGQTH